MDIEKQAKKIGPRIQTFIFAVHRDSQSPFIKVNGNASFDFGVNGAHSQGPGKALLSDFPMQEVQAFKVKQCDHCK